MLNLQNAGFMAYHDFARISNEKRRNQEKLADRQKVACTGLCLFLPISIWYYIISVNSIIMGRVDIYDIVIGYTMIGMLFGMSILLIWEFYEASSQLKNERYDNRSVRYIYDDRFL
jgi:hypothetical protein